MRRHRVRKVKGNKECELCGSESVSHVLWESSACSNSRADFLLKLREKLGNGFERFDALDSLGKSSLILGSELWEEHFDLLLRLVKDYATSGRRRKLNYMVMAHPSLSHQLGIWGVLLGLRGRVVRICVREVSLTLVSFTHLILV